MRLAASAALMCMAMTTQMHAQEVAITDGVTTVTVETSGGTVEITRNQDTDNRIGDDWARTSRPCPEFCIQPMVPAPGVTPIGEPELMEFLNDPDVVVADGRIRRDFEGGAIPGAVNIPYTEAPDRLGELGCEPDFEGFICEGDAIKSVALYCNGPWCGQSPAAARRMIEAGFPAEKIYYYCAGMQGWRMLGLTVTGQ